MARGSCKTCHLLFINKNYHVQLPHSLRWLAAATKLTYNLSRILQCWSVTSLRVCPCNASTVRLFLNHISKENCLSWTPTGDGLRLLFNLTRGIHISSNYFLPGALHMMESPHTSEKTQQTAYKKIKYTLKTCDNDGNKTYPSPFMTSVMVFSHFAMCTSFAKSFIFWKTFEFEIAWGLPVLLTARVETSRVQSPALGHHGDHSLNPEKPNFYSVPPRRSSYRLTFL